MNPMRSVFGSSAAMCVEAASHGDRYRPRAERNVRIQAPGLKDGIPAGMCETCGFPGPHSGPGECIDVLRSRIATLEFKAKAGRGCHADVTVHPHSLKRPATEPTDEVLG